MTARTPLVIVSGQIKEIPSGDSIALTQGGTGAITKAGARVNLGVDRFAGMVNLSGVVNATTPLTKYDLSADVVMLRNSSNDVVTQFSTGVITCDLGLTGPAADGRDQSGAFSASSWIYLYLIWNGSTLATLASTTAPTSFTGSTLPTGYTYWAFVTALFWNASSNIVPMMTRGGRTFYDVTGSSALRVLTAGTATSLTAVSLASVIPPNATYALINFSLNLIHTSAGVSFAVTYRPTGSSAGGIIVLRATTQVANVSLQLSNGLDLIAGTSQQIDYSLSASPATSGGLNIEVLGFAIPNGAS